MSFEFAIEAQCNATGARAGVLDTPHGQIRTPVFMPVGTAATVKGILPEQLNDIGAQIILSNTYHLYLRPGEDIVKEAGGLHSFMNWDKPILTDSGGFQVFSLANTNSIARDGVEFASHIDGSRHMFTPEKSIYIQNCLGADIIMAFDECVAYGASREYVADSLNTTIEWLKRSAGAHSNPNQALFGIVQGGMYHGLRKESALRTCEVELPGYAIGGLSVGESKEVMFDLLAYTTPLLPKEKPRYLMGVGSFDALMAGIENGVDMFDCVLPTRLGRNGSAMTFTGRINLKNAQYKNDFSPLTSECGCYVCQNYSKAYLRHLVVSKEMLASILLSYHNLALTIKFIEMARKSILEGNYYDFKLEFEKAWYNN
ncbi:MAG: tRNA guanosine(34) transglycosylase Tgt [Eubacteriaceae bacterium]|nr:tRNA guanosine(34) transglycosylase Tgt [Eubacteriaceae bacterium]